MLKTTIFFFLFFEGGGALNRVCSLFSPWLIVSASLNATYCAFTAASFPASLRGDHRLYYALRPFLLLRSLPRDVKTTLVFVEASTQWQCGV